MSVTRTTLSSILKEDYLPPIQAQFNQKKLLLRKLKRNRRDVGGEGALIPIMGERTHSYGSRAESGTLPSASSNSYTQSVQPMKFHYAKIKVTGPSLTVARKDKYAFARTLNAEISGATEGFINDFNRQLYGNGSGILTKCGVTSDANTVVLDTTDGDLGHGTRYLQPGMTVDIKTMSTGADQTNGAGIVIDSIDESAGTFAFTGTSVTTAATHAVYVVDNVTAGSAAHEAMGISGIISARNPSSIGATAPANLQGLTIAAAPFWKASVLSASSNRDISLELMHDLLIDIDKKSGLGDGIDFFVTTHEVWKNYGLLLTPDRRYAGTPDKWDGGFKYLTFDGIPVYFDKDCPGNRVFAVNTDHLTLYEEAPVQWDETDGALLKWDGSTDAFEAFLVYYANLGTDRRQAHGVLEDLNH